MAPPSCQLRPWQSLPARGAWREIAQEALVKDTYASLPSRGAWIEMMTFTDFGEDIDKSLPSRGAWIEMFWKAYCN